MEIFSRRYVLNPNDGPKWERESYEKIFKKDMVTNCTYAQNHVGISK